MIIDSSLQIVIEDCFKQQPFTRTGFCKSVIQGTDITLSGEVSLQAHFQNLSERVTNSKWTLIAILVGDSDYFWQIK